MDTLPSKGAGETGAGADCGEAAAATGPASAGAALAALAPPYSNTGVQNTETISPYPEPIEPCFLASVDYLSFTYPTTVPLQDALARLDGCEPLEWTPTDRGGNGYKQGLACGDMRVFHDGQPNMGVFVQMKGKGCDQYASSQYWRTDGEWRGFIGELLEAGCNITRLDLAYDDVGQRVLYMEQVRDAISEGRVVSKWKEANPSGSVSLSETADRTGDMVHFGSIKSEVSGVIYDKGKERMIAGAHWIRCELRTKGEKAVAMASAFVAEGFKAGVAVLRAYLDFKDRSETDSNRSRWVTCDWWDRFCSGIEKAGLKLPKVTRTVDKVRAWVLNQVAPSLAMLLLADGGSTDEPGGLLSLLADGKKRLRQVHENMLRDFWQTFPVNVPDPSMGALGAFARAT